MKVKFKLNTTPCLQYDVKNETPVMHFDEILDKYCECIELSVLGLVPLELLCETNCEDNVDAIEVAVVLSNMENEK